MFWYWVAGALVTFLMSGILLTAYLVREDEDLTDDTSITLWVVILFLSAIWPIFVLASVLVFLSVSIGKRIGRRLKKDE